MREPGLHQSAQPGGSAGAGACPPNTRHATVRGPGSRDRHTECFLATSPSLRYTSTPASNVLPEHVRTHTDGPTQRQGAAHARRDTLRQ